MKLKEIKPTAKESNLLAEAKRNMIAIFAMAIAVCSLIFAKVEYKSVTITDISSHVLTTSYQATLPSRWTIVNYSIQINSSLSLSGGQTGTVELQTSPDNSTWTTVCTAVNGNTGSLTLGLNTLNAQTVQMLTAVPPTYYYRLLPTGASSMAVVNGRELSF